MPGHAAQAARNSSRIACAHLLRADLVHAGRHDVARCGGPCPARRRSPVEAVGLAGPVRTNSAAPWRTRRSWRSGWRCPCRRCPAPSRAPARRAPCASPVLASGAPSEADGSMPSEPVSIAAMSESMSPNRLSVTITSNCLGQRTSCMPPASASMWSSFTSAYSRSWTLGDDLVPQHARLHDVALFRRGHLVAAGAGQLEGDAGDALDLVGVVDLRVDGALLAVAEVDDLLRLAEIDAAGQLAHDQDVEPLDDLALQRRSVGERRIADRRAQIGEQRQAPCAAAAAPLRAAPHKAPCPISARRPRRRAPRRPPAPSPCRLRRSPCHARHRPSRRPGPPRVRSRPSPAFMTGDHSFTSPMASGPMPSPGRRRSLCVIRGAVGQDGPAPC